MKQRGDGMPVIRRSPWQVHPKHHYQRRAGRWRCRDTTGDWWLMPPWWTPGQSIEGFVWR